MKYVICHYSEIALKGKNRSFFEEKLIWDIKRVLHPDLINSVKKISGRILIELSDVGIKSEIEIKKSLNHVFGISSFSFAVKSSQNIEDIKKEVFYLIQKRDFISFKVSTQRSEKTLPFTSQDVNKEVGAFLFLNLKEKKVKLENPDIICYIEIVEKISFIYLDKYDGLGGLPMLSSGKAISLLSGGIDSPVSSFMSMRRGLKMIFVHFHSYPITPQGSIEKVKDIVKILSSYQGESKLYLIPFTEIQKEILLNIKSELRIIFYRRIMLKIASEIMKKEKAQAIITGDSLGQVASQTVENMASINQSIDNLIIRPLICIDKEDIVKLARKIKTFELSILPHDDCCSRFLPQHPETRSKIEEILLEEKKLDIKKIINRAIDEMSCEKIYEFKLDRRY